MGAFYEEIPSDALIKWILDQKLMFVATSPLQGGHINVSPKGGPDFFGVIDKRTFWYVDLTGSGVETLAHLRQPGNGRIVVMFNAFEGPPRIIRLWGHGTALEYGTPAFTAFVDKHKVKTIDGTRAIIVVDIHQVGTSCGFSVPFYDFKGYRSTLNEFFEKRVASEKAGNKKDGIERYWAHKNSESMDKLPAMRRGEVTGLTEGVQPIKKMVGPLAPSKAPAVGSRFRLVDVILVALISFVTGIFLAAQWPTLSRALL